MNEQMTGYTLNNLYMWSHIQSVGEGNGNPVQCSCLENLMDRGAKQLTVHGVTKELDMTQWLNNKYTNSMSVCVHVCVYMYVCIFWGAYKMIYNGQNNTELDTNNQYFV